MLRRRCEERQRDTLTLRQTHIKGQTHADAEGARMWPAFIQGQTHILRVRHTQIDKGARMWPAFVLRASRGVCLTLNKCRPQH